MYRVIAPEPVKMKAAFLLFFAYASAAPPVADSLEASYEEARLSFHAYAAAIDDEIFAGDDLDILAAGLVYMDDEDLMSFVKSEQQATADRLKRALDYTGRGLPEMEALLLQDEPLLALGELTRRQLARTRYEVARERTSLAARASADPPTNADVAYPDDQELAALGETTRLELERLRSEIASERALQAADFEATRSEERGHPYATEKGLDSLAVVTLRQLEKTRDEIGRLDPDARWLFATPGAFLDLADEDLPGVEARMRAHEDRVSAAVDSLRTEIEELERVSGNAFAAWAWRQIRMDSAARNWVAEREAAVGREYLAESLRSGGQWSSISLRAGERRLSAAVTRHEEWDGRADVLMELAAARNRLGRRGSAERAYRAIVLDHPDDPNAPGAAGLWLAHLYERGDHAGVLATLDRLDGMGLAPELDDDRVAYYAGVSALAVGDSDRALRELAKVSGRSAVYPEAELSRGAALAASGLHDEAHTVFVRLHDLLAGQGIDRDTRDRARLGVGLLLYHVGRYSESAEILDDMPSGSPTHAEARLAAARSRFAGGDMAGARDSLLAIRQRHPGTAASAQASLALAEVEEELGDYAAATKWLEDLVAEFGPDHRAAQGTDLLRAELEKERHLVDNLGLQVREIELRALARGMPELGRDIQAIAPTLSALDEDAVGLALASPESATALLPSLVQTAELKLAQVSLAWLEALERGAIGPRKSEVTP